MRTLVIGDIHGNIKAFKQCLKRCKFNYDKDKLICLGDVCDGFQWVKECFDELLKIKTLVYLRGNHDHWAMLYYCGKLFNPDEQKLWTDQGGSNTLKSYGYQIMEDKHLQLLINAKLYHLENNEKDLFVHAGIVPDKKLEHHTDDIFMWDRNLVFWARKKSLAMRDSYKYSGYDNIFVGHTTTECFKCRGVPITEPLHMCNVWMLDTGGGWDGKVSIMDINTKKFWQSDFAKDLYEDVDNGRRR